MQRCRKADANFLLVFLFYFWNKVVRKKELVRHPKVRIKGIDNISINGRLSLGLDSVGFAHKNDICYLHVNGKLLIEGHVMIARGVRFDIEKDAVVKIGDASYINPFTKCCIMHGLTIGKNCSISWDCEFLDEDFHQLSYPGQKDKGDNKIEIGNHVWIASGVKILKGARIPSNCVIAANTVVTGKFEEENVLIGGNPARIIKRDIAWS